jgi:hypothetical protein
LLTIHPLRPFFPFPFLILDWHPRPESSDFSFHNARCGPLRDVHLYDTNDPTTVLGGLTLTSGITNHNLYQIVEILVVPSDDWIALAPEEESYFFLNGEGGKMVDKNDHPLMPGNYFIVAKGGFFGFCMICMVK